MTTHIFRALTAGVVVLLAFLGAGPTHLCAVESGPAWTPVGLAGGGSMCAISGSPHDGNSTFGASVRHRPAVP